MENESHLINKIRFQREQDIALSKFTKDNMFNRELTRKRKEDFNVMALTKKSAAV
jgi:hypothetical protein